ncbi:hypothetical protein KPL28_02720 [Clostridium algidicarnis]|uniref:hypothetical protein n=1 Tax=Clostridium algidicarnis TaxID=37659 RepID=UPI001C0BD938|nr:hypothetical protein [Clostridium algidicarnis]MBU3208547.1 hypothetical protein [Clostridium algidicarnis]
MAINIRFRSKYKRLIKTKEVKFNTMNNELLSLEIKDMYAIKHSLQAALRYKRNKLEKETGLFYRDRLTKDIAREEILLDKFIILIEETKEK